MKLCGGGSLGSAFLRFAKMPRVCVYVCASERGCWAALQRESLPALHFQFCFGFLVGSGVCVFAMFLPSFVLRSDSGLIFGVGSLCRFGGSLERAGRGNQGRPARRGHYRTRRLSFFMFCSLFQPFDIEFVVGNMNIWRRERKI